MGLGGGVCGQTSESANSTHSPFPPLKERAEGEREREGESNAACARPRGHLPRALVDVDVDDQLRRQVEPHDVGERQRQQERARRRRFVSSGRRFVLRCGRRWREGIAAAAAVAAAAAIGAGAAAAGGALAADRRAIRADARYVARVEQRVLLERQAEVRAQAAARWVARPCRRCCRRRWRALARPGGKLLLDGARGVCQPTA